MKLEKNQLSVLFEIIICLVKFNLVFSFGYTKISRIGEWLSVFKNKS